MPSRRVSQNEVHDFVAELERNGAREIRRAPASLKGTVLVRWKPSEAEDAEFRIALRENKGEYVLAAIVVAILVAMIVLASL